MQNWPDKFVYVCSATRGAAVNVIPLAHAGMGRIEGLIVLCGAEKSNRADAKGDSEALGPSQRLVDYAEKYSAGRLVHHRNIQVLQGNPHDIAIWQKTVSEVASAIKLPILFNIKGGTKEMAIGALLALSDRARVITVPNDLVHVEMVTGSERQRMPASAHLSLGMYLDAYGLVEARPKESARWEDFCRANCLQVETFARSVLASADELCRALNSLGRDFWPTGPGQRFSGHQIDPASFRLNQSDKTRLAAAIDALSKFPGCTIKNGILAVEDELVARFLTGTWLEAYIYNRACGTIASVSDVEVRANVELSYPGPRGGPRSSIGELDVAILIRSQLVILEAKTGEMSSKATKRNRETALSQLATLRQQLQGQVGHTFLVNPRSAEFVAGPNSGDIAKRAAEAGIETLFGPDAVEHLVDRLAAIAADSRA